jgi:hypothetical protein
MGFHKDDRKQKFGDLELTPRLLGNVPAGADGQLAVVTDSPGVHLMVRKSGALVPAVTVVGAAVPRWAQRKPVGMLAGMPATNWTGFVIRGVYWLKDRWVLPVMVDTGTIYIYTSTDGINWTYVGANTTGLTGVVVSSMAYGHYVLSLVDVYVMVLSDPSSSGTKIFTSNDLITWTPRYIATTTSFKRVAWAPTLGGFMAVGAGGTILESTPGTDGATWVAMTSGTVNGLYDIVSFPATFSMVAVGAAGTILAWDTTQGLNWTIEATTPGSVRIISSIATNGTTLVAFSQGDQVWTSTDMLNWTVTAIGVNTGSSGIAPYCLLWNSVLAKFFCFLPQIGPASSPDGLVWTLIPLESFPAAAAAGISTYGDTAVNPAGDMLATFWNIVPYHYYVAA